MRPRPFCAGGHLMLGYPREPLTRAARRATARALRGPDDQAGESWQPAACSGNGILAREAARLTATPGSCCLVPHVLDMLGSDLRYQVRVHCHLP
jgi:hypothetical protein